MLPRTQIVGFGVLFGALGIEHSQRKPYAVVPATCRPSARNQWSAAHRSISSRRSEQIPRRYCRTVDPARHPRYGLEDGAQSSKLLPAKH